MANLLILLLIFSFANSESFFNKTASSSHQNHNSLILSPAVNGLKTSRRQNFSFFLSADQLENIKSKASIISSETTLSLDQKVKIQNYNALMNVNYDEFGFSIAFGRSTVESNLEERIIEYDLTKTGTVLAGSMGYSFEYFSFGLSTVFLDYSSTLKWTSPAKL